jgi:hypothetical protein
MQQRMQPRMQQRMPPARRRTFQRAPALLAGVARRHALLDAVEAVQELPVLGILVVVDWDALHAPGRCGGGRGTARGARCACARYWRGCAGGATGCATCRAPVASKLWRLRSPRPRSIVRPPRLWLSA